MLEDGFFLVPGAAFNPAQPHIPVRPYVHVLASILIHRDLRHAHGGHYTLEAFKWIINKCQFF
jgi:hypothetical protein